MRTQSCVNAYKGGRTPPKRDRTRSNDESAKQSRERLEARLKTAREELARLDQELTALGFDSSGLPLQGAQGRYEEDNLALNDESATAITLWAHDITAQPGETYRYALRVRVTNPLFGKAAQVPAEQVEATTSPVLTSEPSDWSDPIAVPMQTVYFVTSGSDGGALGGIGDRTSATIEVYRFYYGFWRMAELSLAPGEPVQAELEMPEGLQTFTVGTDAAKGAATVTGQESVSSMLDFTSDTVLLDVAVAEAGGGQRWVNVFLATGGEVEVRDPSLDEGSDERLRYSESARHGAAGVLGKPGYRPGQPAEGGSSKRGGRGAPSSSDRRDERERDGRDERPEQPSMPGTIPT